MTRRSAAGVAGKTVLITGAARGIGAETARRLAARGARVALVGLEPELLRQVAGECPASVVAECDVTDAGQVAQAVEHAVETFGGLDVVVANAGVGAFGFTRSMDPAAFDRIIEVNVLGVHRTIRAALPHVIERRGYVIPIASLAAIGSLGGMAPYAASKAAVEALADALREELRPHGVDVGCAYFSWIETEMVHGTDATRVGAILRGGMRGPLGKTYAVADAAEALVAGIEGRARWVTVPRWLRAALLFRGLVQPVMDLDPRLRKAVAEADRAALEEVARKGSDATAMVGAGGEADRRARATRVG